MTDIDGNGSVDYREITLLLRSLGLFSTSQILSHFCFPVLDLDGNDTLSRAELAAALSSMMFSVSPPPSPDAHVKDHTKRPLSVRESSARKIDIADDALTQVFDCMGFSEDRQDVHKQQFLDWAQRPDDGTDSSDNIARRFVTGSLFARKDEEQAVEGGAADGAAAGEG